MATITTYLLVSGAETEDVRSHALFETYDFEEREVSDEQQLSALTFALEQALEEAENLEEEVRRFSADMSSAGVVLCEVEERFDQVERLQVRFFQDGEEGAGLEHGHFYNVGTE
jgi:DNA repair ATPase RecN